MKKQILASLLIFIPTLIPTSGHAEKNPYAFGGSCPTQGAWTQIALQQARDLSNVIRELKDNPSCKGMVGAVTSLQAAATALDTNTSDDKQEEHIERLPGEISALRNSVMEGGLPNADASTLLLNRTIDAAATASELNQVSTSVKQSSFADVAKQGLNKLFTRYAGPTKKGLALVTNVMKALPAYRECLIGHPHEGMTVGAGAIKLAASFSAAGEGVGDDLGNAIAGLATLMGEHKMVEAIRKQDETEFWFSISCLLESSTKNYCEAENAQEILQYSQTRYNESMKRTLAGRSTPTYDNPLEGYYLLVRELPVISNWLQKVQFGATPRLMTDATFKNTVWKQVTDLTQTVNTLIGVFNEQLLFMKEQTTITGKRIQLFRIIQILVDQMSGGTEGSSAGTKFFETTIDSNLLPFFLIGLDRIPGPCLASEGRIASMTWDEWMKTANNGEYVAQFQDPDALAKVVENQMNVIISKASEKSSAYFRQRLVVDMPNLVNETLTGQYMSVRDAFRNVYNYLVRFEKHLSTENLDLVMIPSVRETKKKILTFLKSYEKLRALGEKMVHNPEKEAELLVEVNEAAKHVIDTTFDQFNMLFQKDTFLTTRVTTFIEKDFSMRVKAGLNMTPYQQDIMLVTQKQLLDKLIQVHGLNPTNSNIDLAQAQVINTRNLESISEVFTDSIFMMILKMKSIVTGKGDLEVHRVVQKKLDEETETYRQLAWRTGASPFGSGALFNWAAAASTVRSHHPDLLHMPSASLKGRDDKFGNFAQIQALFCAQTLALRNREEFREICNGTVLKSFYNKTAPHLNLRYNSFLPNSAVARSIQANPELTSKNICAHHHFLNRNLVQWLRDQDATMYNSDI